MKQNNKTLRSGRPGQYDAGYHPGIGYRLCCLGMTNADLAFVFEVSEQTIVNWSNWYEEFCQSINKGKTIADAKVTQSLYKRATGYDQPETLNFELQDGEFKKRLQSVDTVKHFPPDVKAIQLWIKNRKVKQN